MAKQKQKYFIEIQNLEEIVMPEREMSREEYEEQMGQIYFLQKHPDTPMEEVEHRIYCTPSTDIAETTYLMGGMHLIIRVYTIKEGYRFLTKAEKKRRNNK